MTLWGPSLFLSRRIEVFACPSLWTALNVFRLFPPESCIIHISDSSQLQEEHKHTSTSGGSRQLHSSALLFCLLVCTVELRLSVAMSYCWITDEWISDSAKLCSFFNYTMQTLPRLKIHLRPLNRTCIYSLKVLHHHHFIAPLLTGHVPLCIRLQNGV